MQISSTNAASSGLAMQALKNLFQTSKTSETGQEMPGAAAAGGAKGPPPGSPPGPPPASMNGGGFSAETMSGLLDAQEESDSLASAIIDEADTDGDGKLSAAEIAASMGVSDASEIEDVFAALDADGDGAASADELSAGLEASRPQGPPPHGGRGGPPSATEMASTLLETADGDADGALGLGEIASALGQEEADLTEAFASLDSNSDGSLAADELTSALQSMLSRQMAAYGASTAASASSVSLAA